MPVKIAIKSHYQDQGTDLYIKKIDPGASYGSGYLVEIYDYGQKVKEEKVNTKKEVERIIKEQKERYNTDRAFENEKHIFISYKIDDIESPSFRKQKGIKVKESAMNAIDKELYKKASRISYLLNASKYPEVPVKNFRYGEEVLNFDDPAPEASVNIDNIGINSETTEDQIVEAIKEALISYFSQTDDAVDQQYNKTKQWLSKVMRSIVSKANETFNLNFSLDSIADKLSSIFSNSGLPGEDVLFKSAKDFTSKTKFSEVAPANFTGTAMTQDRSQVANMSNTTMTSPSTDAYNTMNPKEPLSNDAKNLIDKVNTIKENPYEAYTIIKNTPNSEALVNEIKDKGEGTEAEFLILNSKIASLNYIVDRVNDQFSNFLKYAQVKKGKNSFNAVYATWRKNNSFTPFMDELLSFKKSYTVEGIVKGIQFNDNVLKIYANVMLDFHEASKRFGESYEEISSSQINEGDLSFNYQRAVNLTATGKFSDIIWEAAASLKNVSESKYEEKAADVLKKVNQSGALKDFIHSLLAYSIVTEHVLNIQQLATTGGLDNLQQGEDVKEYLLKTGVKEKGESTGIAVFSQIYNQVCGMLGRELANTHRITSNPNSAKFIQEYFNSINDPSIYTPLITPNFRDKLFSIGVNKVGKLLNLGNKQARSNFIKKAVNIIINENGASGEDSVEITDDSFDDLDTFSEDEALDDIIGLEDDFTPETVNQEFDANRLEDESSTTNMDSFDKEPDETLPDISSPEDSDGERKLIDMLRED